MRDLTSTVEVLDEAINLLKQLISDEK